MGYRSDVQALVYGPKDKVTAMVVAMKMTNTGLYSDELLGHKQDDWWRDAASSSVYTARVYEDGGNYKNIEVAVIRLNIPDVKWYQGYADVDAFEKFLKEANSKWGLATEFVRIGENDDDIETRYEYGEHYECEYKLNVQRSIEYDEPVGVEEKPQLEALGN